MHGLCLARLNIYRDDPRLSKTVGRRHLNILYEPISA